MIIKINYELEKKIIELNRLSDKNQEWSGILYYKFINNNEIEAFDLLLMNLGSSVETEFDRNNPEYIKKCGEYFENDEVLEGLIHSHHNMDTFFSNQDKSELKEGSKTNCYYLSLIVNHHGKYNAKIASIADVKEIITYTDGKSKIKTSKKYIITDCDIEYPKVEDDNFYKVFDNLKKEYDTKSVLPKDYYLKNNYQPSFTKPNNLFTNSYQKKTKSIAKKSFNDKYTDLLENVENLLVSGTSFNEDLVIDIIRKNGLINDVDRVIYELNLYPYGDFLEFEKILLNIKKDEFTR